MKDNSFYNKIHRLGRITVVCALISFMAVPFGLAAVNGISMNIPEILKNAIPLLLTFSISGICENLSFMPIIGSGALYMSCVTGNVSNMKVPAAVNAMEVAGYTAGSDRADEYLHTLVHKSLIRALGLRAVGLVILEDELQLYAVNAASLVDLVNRDLSRVANRLTVSRRRAGKRTYAADDDLIT